MMLLDPIMPVLMKLRNSQLSILDKLMQIDTERFSFLVVAAVMTPKSLAIEYSLAAIFLQAPSLSCPISYLIGTPTNLAPALFSPPTVIAIITIYGGVKRSVHAGEYAHRIYN